MLQRVTRSTVSSRRLKRVVALALGAALISGAASTTAMAATAFVTQSCQPNGQCTSTANFVAAPGEVNDLRVHERSNERFEFRDAANAITPGTNCSRVGGRRSGVVRCRPRDFPNTTNVGPARARTADLNDVLLIVAGRATLNGGSGVDTMTTNARTVNTTLLGGPGNDVLVVAATSTVGHTLRGNQGNDTITGGRSGDAISGGFGNDTVNAFAGADNVDGDDGEDTVSGGTGRDIILGGDGDDRLFGNSDRDRLRGQRGSDGIAGGRNNDRLGGGTGRDRLFGNTGNDLLVGNRNRDRYRAGPGNDRLRSVDGIRERVNCGTGFDRAVVDRVPRDRTAFCNRVRRVTFP